MSKSKGFTLIELLVVIAIIGILSSVVLASLNTARNKAKDGAVQSQLASMRNQAELWSSSQASPTYAGVCAGTQANNGFGGTTGPGLLYATALGNALGNLTSTINVALATAGSWTVVTCHDSANGWLVEAPLYGSTSASPALWCVDSNGNSKKETAASLANAVVCL